MQPDMTTLVYYQNQRLLKQLKKLNRNMKKLSKNIPNLDTPDQEIVIEGFKLEITEEEE